MAFPILEVKHTDGLLVLGVQSFGGVGLHGSRVKGLEVKDMDGLLELHRLVHVPALLLQPRLVCRTCLSCSKLVTIQPTVRAVQTGDIK